MQPKLDLSLSDGMTCGGGVTYPSLLQEDHIKGGRVPSSNQGNNSREGGEARNIVGGEAKARGAIR
jgi:hypothetical protein